MIQYALDTNAVIAILGNRSERLINRIKHQPGGSVAVSAVVVHELYYGAYKSRKPDYNLETIRLFMINIEVLDITLEDARVAGEIRAALASRGTPIGPYDVLIAGQAKARNLILLTSNTGEFSRVDGLQIQDWTK